MRLLLLLSRARLLLDPCTEKANNVFFFVQKTERARSCAHGRAATREGGHTTTRHSYYRPNTHLPGDVQTERVLEI